MSKINDDDSSIGHTHAARAAWVFHPDCNIKAILIEELFFEIIFRFFKKNKKYFQNFRACHGPGRAETFENLMGRAGPGREKLKM